MTKSEALLNFQAVINYLMWKNDELICTTIDQENKYFECRYHFNPDEWPVEYLQNEVDRILDSDAKVDICTIRSSKNMCLTIDWYYS